MYHERNVLFAEKNKDKVSFSRYLDFCIFDESTYLKICDVIIDITAN